MTADHVGDHQGLLHAVAPPAATDAKLDAIIVPSARTPPYLRTAARLAEKLGCLLVILCSKHAKRAEILKHFDDHGIVADVVAIDVDVRTPSPLPTFATSKRLAGRPFGRRSDVSYKRNLGLALARTIGWRRVFFLDDDMQVPDWADLGRAAGLLDDHDGVGLNISGFPDNSVVCHAHRDSGGWQATFVGGGALAVPTDRVSSFFPDIYNEDWFFLLGDWKLQRVTLVGEALQQRYDPYANPERARSEELGDVLAEGIFTALGQDRTLADADVAYWRIFLERRAALIEDVMGRTGKLVASEKRHAMLQCLGAARARLRLIRPELCAGYLQDWKADRELWREFLAYLPSIDLEKAIAHFGLSRHTTLRGGQARIAAQELTPDVSTDRANAVMSPARTGSSKSV